MAWRAVAGRERSVQVAGMTALPLIGAGPVGLGGPPQATSSDATTTARIFRIRNLIV
jgi:hypothetical protein